MSVLPEFIQGEYQRTLDERFRLSLPAELLDQLGETKSCILAKERPGCLSLWNTQAWQTRLDAGLDLLRGKMRAGKLEGRLDQVQMLGRLLSSRHRTVELAGRGRLLVPEGFREFLKVDAGGEVMVIGAGVCVEVWNPRAWLEYLESRMPKFGRLFDQLSS
jgi:MraZ protein